MATVSNRTRKPLSVALPGGKTLHLGPGKTGQVAAKALQHAPVKKRIAAGEIEILDEGERPADGFGGGRRGRAGMLGHAASSGMRRSGDR